ncbi:Rieske (2Fe-2S) protein [Evansella cellulosilytica]|uniref:Rieske (2Fe-2S) iron-sulfur domain n=1 Tax=Evansella cellulosilytica (strain ATCC 21833 / DSM 2522 / FERM P-1141 / JCM 9156 / N-4) TaxID=649639 RepID=E6TTW9_EVAC2|nr:Rieske 2Fe-2S domain-containing protein [Evansella cellulosilytica]ADU32000.1 Rieske (2Fe-2S) iron-sulfur domain [Evansella cellulosilytica DSM 2522]
MSEKVYVCSLDELKESTVKVVKGGKHGIAALYEDGQVYAVDNRCPHLGFPLHMGSTCDGILTCHWHHARFDIKSGGTMDPWADDVPTYPVEIKGGDVWVLTEPHQKQTINKLKARLKDGLEQNISLVIAKAVVGLMEAGEPPVNIAKIGVEFGTKHRWNGWRSGLTILTAMTNVLPYLDKNGKILALYQGLVHVSRESAGMGTRFLLGPLSTKTEENQPSLPQLTKWYRNNIEVRDVQGAERVLLTAIELGASTEELSRMMMTAITDHFYMNIGHTLDFHNKAFEMVDQLDATNTDYILTSLLPELSNASRSEESHSWQSPIDLVTPLKNAFEQIATFDINTSEKNQVALDERSIVDQLLSDKPLETVELLTSLLKKGATPTRLAKLVTVAATERIARFHVQNEFRDWDTVLHTFTHAHAVHQMLRRSSTIELTRAIFHGAMTIYLDRFLNIPSARRPKPTVLDDPPKVDAFLELLNQQQQTDEAAKWVVNYLASGGDRMSLFNILGHSLLREDAEFHTFQVYEAAIMEHELWDEEDTPFADDAKDTFIIAAARYLAAHAPTAREVSHTAKIAMRLHRGEKLFED